MPPAIAPDCSALADALTALGAAAAAFRRLLGTIAPPWHIVAMVAGGQLLSPLRSD
jgi:hypothetical protein